MGPMPSMVTFNRPSKKSHKQSVCQGPDMSLTGFCHLGHHQLQGSLENVMLAEHLASGHNPGTWLLRKEIKEMLKRWAHKDGPVISTDMKNKQTNKQTNLTLPFMTKTYPVPKD